MQSYELSNGKQAFVLPKLEYQLMEIFMLNRGIYLSSENLLVKVWGYDTGAELGTVWIYISYLCGLRILVSSYRPLLLINCLTNFIVLMKHGRKKAAATVLVCL